jgi:hypothetical protein
MPLQHGLHVPRLWPGTGYRRLSCASGQQLHSGGALTQPGLPRCRYGGRLRKGRLAPARSPAAPCSLTAVWIDKMGQLTARPLSHTDVWERAIEAVAVTAATLILLLSAISWAASTVLDHQRLARWEADWLAVEPQWTNRR